MKKKITISLGILLLLGGITAFYFYQKIYSNNIQKSGYVYISGTSSYEDVIALITPFVKNSNSFQWVAEKKNYPNHIKSGKYKITKGMSNNQLINMLRSGKQEIIKLSFNNQDSLEKLAGRISKQISADSISLLNAFTDSDFLTKNHFTKATALAMYIPNSYDFFWDTSAEKFRNKMLQEYHHFWNSRRMEKAEKLQLKPQEISTLASIVQKETVHYKEQPTVAGLYLNRLKKGWALQSDPTVIYALQKEKNVTTPIRRVLTKYLKIDSPYNTYKNVGLPPGPIGMPDIKAIDAVLNAEKHSYFYMCASTKNIGQHIFAKSLSEHNRNASKYQTWLNKQKIMK
ncbi:MAG: endolytic transglycosylase MltG [Flavobacteriaceae bacterium]|nr:endolytic transglycosylase MltG [Flavobacteriaceae bacterium]